MEYSEEFNALPAEEQVKQLKKTLEWFNDFADAVQGDRSTYESACEYADEKESERYPELHTDCTGTYCSIHDFGEQHNLEDKADEVFGEGWEAENDVEQIKQLAGDRHAVVVEEPTTEREARADDYIEVFLK